MLPTRKHVASIAVSLVRVLTQGGIGRFGI
jgi:hypothetical protein